MKEFTKQDLRTGDIVVTKDGRNAILIGNRFKMSNHLNHGLGLADIDDYNDELTYIKPSRRQECSIEKVYRIVDGYCYSLNQIIDRLPEENVELIWERKREIDWNKVPKFTKVQVRDNNEKEWRNRYFIECSKGYCFGYPYLATHANEFSYEDGDFECWGEIRMFDESEIKEEWYK